MTNLQDCLNQITSVHNRLPAAKDNIKALKLLNAELCYVHSSLRELHQAAHDANDISAVSEIVYVATSLNYQIAGVQELIFRLAK
jgi:hypothetical protein